MVFSQKSREGYLLIDHRASPGIPADVAQQLHLDPAQVAGGKLLEAASLTCSHCKVVVIKNPLRIKERTHCFKCNHYVCDFCGAAMAQPDYSHVPFDKRVDDELTRAAHGDHARSPLILT